MIPAPVFGKPAPGDYDTPWVLVVAESPSVLTPGLRRAIARALDTPFAAVVWPHSTPELIRAITASRACAIVYLGETPPEHTHTIYCCPVYNLTLNPETTDTQSLVTHLIARVADKHTVSYASPHANAPFPSPIVRQ